MKYEEAKFNEDFKLDDSIVKETVNLIENLIEKKINADIKDQNDLKILLDNPELLITDSETITDIKNLKSLIIEMSGMYYA